MTKKTYLTIATAIVIFVSNTCFSQVQTVRINCETPSGYVRQLLLGFTEDNAASDGVDYGYDALNVDNFPDDFNWIIENERYVIQGVGEYNNNKQYPIGVFLTNSGTISFSLHSLGNFENDINIYIYDNLENSYTQINNSSYSVNLNSGNYLDRYFITFSTEENINPDNSLSINNINELDLTIKYIKNTQDIIIESKNNSIIYDITLLNILGAKLLTTNYSTNNKIIIPIQNLNNQIVIAKINTKYGNISKKLIIQ